MRAVAFPDSEALATAWLREGLGVAVATDLSGWRSGESRIVVTRIGGVPSLPYRIDRPRLDIDVFADSKEAAHDLAAAARVRLHEMPTGVFAGAVVADARDEMGLRYLPDPDTGSPRYVFSIELVVRPNP